MQKILKKTLFSYQIHVDFLIKSIRRRNVIIYLPIYLRVYLFLTNQILQQNV